MAFRLSSDFSTESEQSRVTEILFLGHSYIRRLAQFVYSGKNSNVGPEFGLHTDPVNVVFRGIGGARVRTINDELSRALRQYSPEIVFLHIGGNDILHDDDDMKQLATEVFDIAYRLNTEFQVKQVVVSQMLSRATARCANYNTLVRQFNVQLASKIKACQCKGIVF